MEHQWSLETGATAVVMAIKVRFPTLALDFQVEGAGHLQTPMEVQRPNAVLVLHFKLILFVTAANDVLEVILYSRLQFDDSHPMFGLSQTDGQHAMGSLAVMVTPVTDYLSSSSSFSSFPCFSSSPLFPQLLGPLVPIGRQTSTGRIGHSTVTTVHLARETSLGRNNPIW